MSRPPAANGAPQTVPATQFAEDHSALQLAHFLCASAEPWAASLHKLLPCDTGMHAIDRRRSAGAVSSTDSAAEKPVVCTAESANACMLGAAAAGSPSAFQKAHQSSPMAESLTTGSAEPRRQLEQQQTHMQQLLEAEHPDLVDFAFGDHPVVTSLLPLAQKLTLLPRVCHLTACCAHFARKPDTWEFPLAQPRLCSRLLQLLNSVPSVCELCVHDQRSTTNTCDMSKSLMSVARHVQGMTQIQVLKMHFEARYSEDALHSIAALPAALPNLRQSDCELTIAESTPSRRRLLGSAQKWISFKYNAWASLYTWDPDKSRCLRALPTGTWQGLTRLRFDAYTSIAEDLTGSILRGLPRLAVLDVSMACRGDDDLASLVDAVPILTSLTLRMHCGAHSRDAAFAQLAKLPHLSELHLFCALGKPASSDASSSGAALTSLTFLRLCEVPGQALVRRLPALAALQVVQEEVDHADLQQLQALPALRSLTIHASAWSLAGAAGALAGFVLTLQGIAGLQHLDISGCHISLQLKNVSFLTALTQLTNLQLEDCTLRSLRPELALASLSNLQVCVDMASWWSVLHRYELQRHARWPSGH